MQLIGEVRQPIPARPGRFERYDYEYRRNGTVNLFEACLDLAIAPNASLGISWTGQFADQSHDNTVKGNFSWRF